MTIVNQGVWERLAEVAASFQSAQPFRYVVVDDFLDPEVARRMLAEFPHVEDPDSLLNEFGVKNRKCAVSDVRSIGPVYRRIDDYIAGPEFRKLMETITGMEGLLYDPEYLGAGTHENFEGAGLDPHVDFNFHSTTGLHRRLNAIVYLNDEWDIAWGGSIQLHRNPWDPYHDEVVTIEPSFNRCVIFETNEYSWHSVPIIHLPRGKKHLGRKSFTIYMYSETRPEHEVSAEHGTIYVQPNLPEHLVPGHQLTEEDLNELKANFQRRNHYLQALYEREKSFSRLIADLRAALEASKRRVPLPLCGFAELGDVREPPFPDGWLGEEISVSLAPIRPATGVTLQLWRNDAPEEPLRYELRASGEAIEGECRHSGPLRLHLPFPARVRDPFELTFRVEGCRSPKERGVGDDLRRLSFVLQRLEVND